MAWRCARICREPILMEDEASVRLKYGGWKFPPLNTFQPPRLTCTSQAQANPLNMRHPCRSEHIVWVFIMVASWLLFLCYFDPYLDISVMTSYVSRISILIQIHFGGLLTFPWQESTSQNFVFSINKLTQACFSFFLHVA